MKTIIHVIDSLGCGGAETLLVGTIKALNNTRNIIVVLNEINEFGVIDNCEEIICLNYKNNLSIPLCAYRLRKIINHYKGDVVHSHLFLSTIIARLACPANVKLVFSVHNLLSNDAFKKNFLSKYAELLTYDKTQSVIFVSKSSEEDYGNYIRLKGKSFVLYNFIEDRFFDNFYHRKTIKKPLRLIAVGNLREQKNLKYLINAFKSLKGSDVTLDIYGDGPLKGELDNDIKEFDLPINLKGRVDNISELHVNYDAFVMASLYEGFGIALVEAMAGGLPLIVSDIPVFQEVTKGNALFFNPFQVSSFVDIIQSIINEKTNLSSLSLDGFKIAKETADKSEYIKKLNSIYNQ